MKTVKTPLKEMVSEHKRLVKILKHGNRKELNQEAAKQNKELKKYMRKK